MAAQDVNGDTSVNASWWSDVHTLKVFIRPCSDASFFSSQRAPFGCSPQPAGGAEESDAGGVCPARRGGAQHEEPPVPGMELVVSSLTELKASGHGAKAPSLCSPDSFAPGRYHAAEGGSGSAAAGWRRPDADGSSRQHSAAPGSSAWGRRDDPVFTATQRAERAAGPNQHSRYTHTHRKTHIFSCIIGEMSLGEFSGLTDRQRHGTSQRAWSTVHFLLSLKTSQSYWMEISWIASQSSPLIINVTKCAAPAGFCLCGVRVVWWRSVSSICELNNFGVLARLLESVNSESRGNSDCFCKIPVFVKETVRECRFM